MLNIFQTSDFYFFRKPHYVASAFWKEKSFLDYVFIDHIDLPNSGIDYTELDNKLLEYINQQIQSLKIESIQNMDNKIIQDLINTFWESKEYWLLNRLDNDTWGLLYFAKTLEIYDNYKSKQNQNLITKFYIAQVSGNPFYKTDNKEIIIDYPIMHHKFSEDRMIYIKEKSDINKWSWKQHQVATKISLLDFDKTKNISTLLISISKWIRHQIRIHLSSIWCPIIWESIYSNYKTQDFLHLRSIWFK
jgi:23S rRNA-/tRNA-specific pseudouridylate synthase